jgi:hypothetical protein
MSPRDRKEHRTWARDVVQEGELDVGGCGELLLQRGSEDVVANKSVAPGLEADALRSSFRAGVSDGVCARAVGLVGDQASVTRTQLQLPHNSVHPGRRVLHEDHIVRVTIHQGGGRSDRLVPERPNAMTKPSVLRMQQPTSTQQSAAAAWIDRAASARLSSMLAEASTSSPLLRLWLAVYRIRFCLHHQLKLFLQHHTRDCSVRRVVEMCLIVVEHEGGGGERRPARWLRRSAGCSLER